jgi:hypothetical protein
MNTAMRYVSFILLLVSCVEPVRLPELSSQPVLVVDGMITDEPATHSVVLSFSGTVDHDVDNPNRVTGALVTIVNDLQEEHELSESDRSRVQRYRWADLQIKNSNCGWNRVRVRSFFTETRWFD